MDYQILTFFNLRINTEFTRGVFDVPQEVAPVSLIRKESGECEERHRRGLLDEHPETKEEHDIGIP
jgi:hypothetical protein